MKKIRHQKDEAAKITLIDSLIDVIERQFRELRKLSSDAYAFNEIKWDDIVNCQNRITPLLDVLKNIESIDVTNDLLENLRVIHNAGAQWSAASAHLSWIIKMMEDKKAKIA